MFSSEVNVAYSTGKHEVCNHKCTILCLLECMWVNDLGSVTHTSVRTGLTAALPVLTLVIDFTWLKLLSCKLPFSLLYIVTLWTRELYTVPIHTHATKNHAVRCPLKQKTLRTKHCTILRKIQRRPIMLIFNTICVLLDSTRAALQYSQFKITAV